MPSVGDIIAENTANYQPSTVASSNQSDREEAAQILTGTDGREISLDEAFQPGFFWQDAVVDQILADIKAISSKTDMDLGYVTGWFKGQQLNLINYLEKNFLNGPLYGGGEGGLGVDPNSPEGIYNLFQAARGWVAGFVPGFRDALLLPTKKGGSGGGSGSIRGQFDLNQLTEAVQQLSQGLILDDFPGAKALAKAFVDAVVANPNQKLDFETFVRSKILDTARAKMIYKNKPDSLTHEQYLQPFVQSFQQMVGPGFGDQLADTAIGGAALNADPSAYMARLQRTSQVQSSTPFLSKLGNRMTSFAQVLR